MTIGERIRKKRIELGITQEELAQKAGYKSRSSINKIELSRDLPLKKIQKVADALNLSPSELAGWSPEAQAVISRVSDAITGSKLPTEKERKKAFWERAEENPEFMKYIKMLFYIPPDRQRFIYETIEAQDRSFKSTGSEALDA